MKYTKEQMEHMLEYAKKWYPLGTKFKYIGPLASGYETVRNELTRWEMTSNPLQIYANGGQGRLFGRYKDNIYKWAEIIDGPQPPPYIPLEEVTNYEIY